MIDPNVDLRLGDVRDVLRTFPEKIAQVAITSPPYWGLRDYGVSGQLGSEPTVDEYIANMVDVFREVKRVLRDDGNLYLNLGDCYARGFGGGSPGKKSASNKGSYENRQPRPLPSGCKAKDLVGVPWLVAFALRADGWFLREDIVWHKNNPMPESVTDRCTRAHEYLFHLTKSTRYYYDAEAIKEPYATVTEKEAESEYHGQDTKSYSAAGAQSPSDSKRRILESIKNGTGRNRRDVWKIPVQPYKGGHFATFPEALVEPCVLAGSSEGGGCCACGSPARRVVVKDAIPDSIRQKFEESRTRTARDTGRTDGHTNYKPNFRRGSTTVGWERTCGCGDVGFEPQTVCDPFMGSGRAGIVARRHGRSVIGAELNEDYFGQAWANILAIEPPNEEAA